jgi:hypothetical protein
MFVELDCSLLEINPLIVTQEGDVLALDGKVNFDSNGLFRHPELLELRDLHEEDQKEVEASKFDLSYIALDGNIGCMVNGAGLAMGTMDVIKLYGGNPANFLDVGGGATAEKVTAAFRILLSDSQVKGVLVNIFGIMGCDDRRRRDAVKQVKLSCRWWCAWRERTSRRARCWPTRSCRSSPPTTWATPPEAAGRRRRALARRPVSAPAAPPAAPCPGTAATRRETAKDLHEHLGRQEHQADLPGFHRQGGRSTQSRRSPTGRRWSAA